jgi:hypothetical protein
VQGLADQGTQVIADTVLVPDGAREQALHAIGPCLPGLFSESINHFCAGYHSGEFAGRATCAGGRAGRAKRGRQTLMEMEQAHGPGANRTQAWPSLLRYGMLGVLHAGLLSDG